MGDLPYQGGREILTMWSTTDHRLIAFGRSSISAGLTIQTSESALITTIDRYCPANVYASLRNIVNWRMGRNKPWH